MCLHPSDCRRIMDHVPDPSRKVLIALTVGSFQLRPYSRANGRDVQSGACCPGGRGKSSLGLTQSVRYSMCFSSCEEASSPFLHFINYRHIDRQGPNPLINQWPGSWVLGPGCVAAARPSCQLTGDRQLAAHVAMLSLVKWYSRPEWHSRHTFRKICNGLPNIRVPSHEQSSF